LKIALDATYSVGKHLSGIGVYSREIMRGLCTAYPDARFLYCYRPHRFFQSLRDQLPSNASRALLGDWWAPAAVDVFHGLNQRLPIKLRSLRTVCTFHDLFVLTSEYSSADFRRRFAQQAAFAAERADLIITVSQFTAGQVESLLRVERARLRVVPHGVHQPEVVPPPVARREKLILHVGALQRRKNLIRLVEAFEHVTPDWHLTLVGSAGFESQQIFRRIEDSPARARIHVVGYVFEGQLRDLYRRAAILAFPSLDEGFGMPVLEAMAAGVPVLTSNRSALPEVAGEAAVLVEPTDVGAITAGLQKLTQDEGLRRVLAERGYERIKLFTWDAAVSKTWAVYRELLG
jgi:glycosyltransferase involved in cell wall biosynthesis